MEPENAGECNADAPARYNGTRSLTAVEVRMKRFAIALALAVLAPAAAPASQQGQIVMKNWQAADKCAKQAHDAFPDFTPDANAKRDAKMSECLENLNQPTRAPSSPRP